MGCTEPNQTVDTGMSEVDPCTVTDCKLQAKVLSCFTLLFQQSTSKGAASDCIPPELLQHAVSAAGASCQTQQANNKLVWM